MRPIPEGAMRPHHRTLNRQQVHRSASRFLQERLPLRDYKRSVTIATLWAVLLVTAAEVSSLHATCSVARRAPRRGNRSQGGVRQPPGLRGAAAPPQPRPGGPASQGAVPPPATAGARPDLDPLPRGALPRPPGG